MFRAQIVELMEAKKGIATKIGELETRKRKLEEELANVLADLNSTAELRQRGDNFSQAFGNRVPPMCVHCWVEDGAEVAMPPIDSPDSRDHFQCRRCDRTLVVEP